MLAGTAGATLLTAVALATALSCARDTGRPAGAFASAASPPAAFAATVPNAAPPQGPAPAGMVWIPGGEFSMGAADPRGTPHGGHDTMADARPIHRVYVDGFWMDRTEVTNDEFARFVRATGHVTVAERKPKPQDYPDAPPESLVAGSVVFTPPREAVPLDDARRWWSYVRGADWRHPRGPGSDIKNNGSYPVVQVAYEDAAAYATWAQKRLPTEAEWEFAARGGLTGKIYAWGDDLRPAGVFRANTYQGRFPIEDDGEDGHRGIAPVAQFPAEGYGLYDMSGNVWEWVGDWYRPDYYAGLAAAAGVARNPRGPADSYDPDEPGAKKRVQRGGSWLCTDQYCARYRVGARGKGEVTTGSDHLGFRCVRPATR